MTEKQCLQLLRVIRTLALAPYPFPPNSPPVSDIIVKALGQIAGLAGRAISLSKGMEEDC